MDDFASKLVRATLMRTIINQEIALTEIFVMAKDKSFVEDIAIIAAKVFFYPVEFVAPCGGIVHGAVESI